MLRNPSVWTTWSSFDNGSPKTTVLFFACFLRDLHLVRINRMLNYSRTSRTLDCIFSGHYSISPQGRKLLCHPCHFAASLRKQSDAALQRIGCHTKLLFGAEVVIDFYSRSESWVHWFRMWEAWVQLRVVLKRIPFFQRETKPPAVVYPVVQGRYWFCYAAHSLEQLLRGAELFQSDNFSLILIECCSC